ncbi:4Fe-4S dicluster domain-containing protein [bacterium]|nr:4Fe-4S dicluster domain-containing protein [bacterium]
MSDLTLHLDTHLCDLCGGCLAVCPVECLFLGVESLRIDQEQCIRCELCLPACPVGALSLAESVEDAPL